MNVETTKFSGALLRRGFWVYVWRITPPTGDEMFYVGRTGDSSSSNAGSPLARLSAHLDLRPNAKGNALLRNLRIASVEPLDCEFELCACGPLFPEQACFEDHCPFRDKVAAIESYLARALIAAGFKVLGSHGRPQAITAELEPMVTDVIEHVRNAFALSQQIGGAGSGLPFG